MHHLFDMNTLLEYSVVRHEVENIGIIARMSDDTQSREGDCQIASFDSSLPQIVRINCRRNLEDNLNGIWQSWDKVKEILKDKNGPSISKSDIRDAIGKASGDRHLSQFAFVVYGLIVFPKPLQYLSVELADYLFQIEKGVCVLSARPTEEFLESEWPPNQSIKEWIQNGAISYSSLMVLSQYEYDQCVPATSSLNRVEALV
ncbi:hypothetical protein Gotur_002304 [Gossypium turneri]